MKLDRVRDFTSTLSDLRNIPIEIAPVRGTLTENRRVAFRLPYSHNNRLLDGIRGLKETPQFEVSLGAYGIRTESQN